MTEATDSMVGTVGGLIGLGIMANMAGKMIGGGERRTRAKPRKKKYHKQSVHWY